MLMCLLACREVTLCRLGKESEAQVTSIDGGAEKVVYDRFSYVSQYWTSTLTRT